MIKIEAVSRISAAKNSSPRVEGFSAYRGVSPLSCDWTFYTVGSEVSTNMRNLLMKGDIVGLAEIKGIPALWVPFDAFSPKKLGYVYKMGAGYEKAAKLKKLKVSMDDARAAYMTILWDRSKPSDREALIKQFAHLSLSNEFKKVPAKVYRGLAIPPDGIEQLKIGKPYALKSYSATSWSAHKETAEIFARMQGGVILTLAPKTADVIVNLQSLIDLFKLPIVERLSYEVEILLKGNGGIDVIDKNTVFEIVKKGKG